MKHFYTNYMGKTINFDDAQQMYCANVDGMEIYHGTAEEVMRHIDMKQNEQERLKELPDLMDKTDAVNV